MNGICKFSIASGLVVAVGFLALHVGSPKASESRTDRAAEARESVRQPPVSVDRPHEEDVGAHGFRRDGDEEAGDCGTRSAARQAVPPAIRLSDDFRLPAAVTGVATMAVTNKHQVSSPQIHEVSGRLVDVFYREVSEELVRAGGWENDVERDPESGEETAVVKPGNGMDRIRLSADERYRALFGADAFNAATVASAKERMSPVSVQSTGD